MPVGRRVLEVPVAPAFPMPSSASFHTSFFFSFSFRCLVVVGVRWRWRRQRCARCGMRSVAVSLCWCCVLLLARCPGARGRHIPRVFSDLFQWQRQFGQSVGREGSFFPPTVRPLRVYLIASVRNRLRRGTNFTVWVAARYIASNMTSEVCYDRAKRTCHRRGGN